VAHRRLVHGRGPVRQATWCCPTRPATWRPTVCQGGRPLQPARSGPDASAYRDELARFLDGLEIAGPGLVQMHQWRPEASDPVAPSSGYAVVARKP